MANGASANWSWISLRGSWSRKTSDRIESNAMASSELKSEPLPFHPDQSELWPVQLRAASVSYALVNPWRVRLFRKCELVGLGFDFARSGSIAWGFDRFNVTYVWVEIVLLLHD